MINGEERTEAGTQYFVDLTIRLGLIALTVYVSVTLLWTISGLLLWAFVIAVAANPLYVFIRRHMRLKPRYAATVLGLLLLVVLLAPSAMLAASGIETLEDYARQVQQGELLAPPAQSVREWPLIGQPVFDVWQEAANDMRALTSAHKAELVSLAKWLARVGGSIAFEILQLAGAIAVASVLLAYSDRLIKGAQRLAQRVAGPKGTDLVGMVGATIRNVAQGVIGVAMLQALLLGVGLLAARVPFAGVITFANLVLSIVQIGPYPTMLAAIAWVWISAPTWVALVFTVYTVPLLFLDDILGPIVMARGLNTPMVIILLGVVCGAITAGLLGLFISPVVLAVAYDLTIRWLDRD
jgi:predicted PurR-regulated permease PerM